MIFEQKLIEGIQWNEKNDKELSILLERISITLKKKNISSNHLWEEAIRNNSYAVSLTWGKMHKRLVSDDIDMIDLKERLRKSVIKEVYQWHYIYKHLEHINNKDIMENQIINETDDVVVENFMIKDIDEDMNIFGTMDLREMNQYLNTHFEEAENVLLTALYIKYTTGINLFFKIYVLSPASIRKIIKRIEYAGNTSGMLIRLLFVSQGSYKKDGNHIQAVICKEYVFKGRKYENDRFLKRFCQNAVEHHAIFDLRNILTLFPDISLVQICHKSKEDFEEMAKTFKFPLGGIRFYYDLLKADGWFGQELLDEVGKLCVFFGCAPNHAINDYVYLCWKLQEFPKEAEKILAETIFPEIPKDIQIPIRTMAVFLDETFLVLLKSGSNQILKFLLKMGVANPYLYKADDTFKKRHVWYDGAGKYLPTYTNYVQGLIARFGKQEVIDIYMNSGLKGILDFHYFIKRLFEKEFKNWEYFPFINLSTYLGKYRFVGLFKNNGHNFRVSVSSVCSTYLFPIHIKWSTDNAQYIQENLTENTSVSFVITHADKRRGMIFVSDVIKIH